MSQVEATSFAGRSTAELPRQYTPRIERMRHAGPGLRSTRVPPVLPVSTSLKSRTEMVTQASV